MAETDLTPEEAGADTRLPLYNVGDYDPATNEFGFDNDGHQVNQMRQARDAGVMGRLARRLAIYVRDVATQISDDRRQTGEDVEAASRSASTALGAETRARDEANRAASYGNPNALTTERLFQLYW